jgi:hypothetical protein
MSLINPDDYHIASVECTGCDVKIVNPTDMQKWEFARDHIHGNEVLQRWFDRRPKPESPTFPDDEEPYDEGFPLSPKHYPVDYAPTEPTLTPIVCFQHDGRHGVLLATHVFNDYDELGAWLDSQETEVTLVFQPRDELL